jgi:hypothetical protein
VPQLIQQQFTNSLALYYPLEHQDLIISWAFGVI